jgi:hypothetical protein
LPNGDITVRMDTIGTGHSWPSGAAHDRRAWLEVTAYDAAGNVLFTHGVTPDGMDPIDDPSTPNTAFYDRTFADAAKTTPAHFFWDVQAETVGLLRPPVTLDPTDPRFDHSSTATFHLGGTIANMVDKIDARIRIRPFPFEMLDQLIASGDLDASFRAKIPTLDIEGTMREWTRATMDINSRCNPF